MKKKNLSLKLAALLLAFGGFGAVLGFANSTLVYAMEDVYDNLDNYTLNAVRYTGAKPIKNIKLENVDGEKGFVSGMKIKYEGFQPSTVYCEDRKCMKRMKLFKDLNRKDEDFIHSHLATGFEKFVPYIDSKCGVSDLCFVTMTDMLINAYKCSSDGSGKPRFQGKDREDAEDFLRREIIDLPDQIESCFSDMEFFYDQLVADEAQKKAEGRTVVSYKKAFKSAAEVELAKIRKCMTRERSIPSLTDLYKNINEYSADGYIIPILGYEDLFEKVLNDYKLYRKIKKRLFDLLDVNIDDSDSGKLFKNISFKKPKDKYYYDI